jgi:hypothetical protein
VSAPATAGSALEVLERLLRQAQGAAREAQEDADFFLAEDLEEVQQDLGRFLAVLKERRGDYS